MLGKCYICGRWSNLEQHHIFGGANRKKSDKYKLTVGLCHTCHNEPPEGVHFNQDNMLKLKQMGQLKALKENSWTIEDFRREFGKNYL